MMEINLEFAANMFEGINLTIYSIPGILILEYTDNGDEVDKCRTGYLEPDRRAAATRV
jgi:hypothetical protein